MSTTWRICRVSAANTNKPFRKKVKKTDLWLKSPGTDIEASPNVALWLSLYHLRLDRAGKGKPAAAQFCALSQRGSPGAAGSGLAGASAGHAPKHCAPPAAPASSRSPSGEGGTARCGPLSHQPPPIRTRNSLARSRLRHPIPTARTVFSSGVRHLGAGTLGTKLRSGARRRKRAAGRGLPGDGPQPRSR